MKAVVISKLKNLLEKSIRNEAQVVYILTRIGKIIELEKSKKNYAVLNFYRNWSVHSEIDRTEPVTDILSEFIKNKENRFRLSLHNQFSSELNSFLKKHNLPQLNNNRLNNFIYYLGKVIADTPIKITVDGQRYIISISEPAKKDWSGLYVISPTSSEGRENRARNCRLVKVAESN